MANGRDFAGDGVGSKQPFALDRSASLDKREGDEKAVSVPTRRWVARRNERVWKMLKEDVSETIAARLAGHGVGSKRQCALDRFATQDETEEFAKALSEPSRRFGARLDERVWRMLPEDVLDVIAARLPFAAKCRFRCVSRRWRRVLSRSLPPMCTIMSGIGDWNAKFYCQSEKKWFPVPSNSDPALGRTWEVVDVDAGLVCYQRVVDGKCWLRVCNPLKTSASQLIAPGYPHRKLGFGYAPSPPKMKLFVDTNSKAYKVVAILDALPCTAVYDSESSEWHVIESAPFFDSYEAFAWKNMVFAYNTKQGARDPKPIPAFIMEEFGAEIWQYLPHVVAVFNMKAGEWIDVKVEFPPEFHGPRKHVFLSDNNQVLLVLFPDRTLPWPHFAVWKLLDECSSIQFDESDSFPKWDKWEKVIDGSGRAVGDIVDLRGQYLASAGFGAGYVYFTFCGDRIKEDVSETRKCLRYSFGTSSWSVVSCPGGWGEGSDTKFYIWKPCLEIDPRSHGQRNIEK